MNSERLYRRAIKAIYTVIYVYWLGIVYWLKEFLFDHFVRKNQTLLEKNFKETKLLTELDELKDLVEKEGKNRQKGGHKIAVLTGADGTIGTPLLEFLLTANFVVLTIGLNYPKVEHKNIIFFKCDLLDLKEVALVAKKIRKNFDRITLLICNAGVMLSSSQKRTTLLENNEKSNNSFESLQNSSESETTVSPCDSDTSVRTLEEPEPHLTVNCLAHALLFDRIKKSLENSTVPRAVFVSSATCHAGNIWPFLRNKENSNKLWKANNHWTNHISGYKHYADSKLLLSLYTLCLGNELRNSGSKIQVASVHPGVVSGSLYKNAPLPVRFFINRIIRPFLRKGEDGALQILRLCFGTDFGLCSGSYYENGNQIDLLTKNRLGPKQLESIGRIVRNRFGNL